MEFLYTVFRFHTRRQDICAILCQEAVSRTELLVVDDLIQRDTANILDELTNEIAIHFVVRRVVRHGVRRSDISHFTCFDVGLDNIDQCVFRDCLIAECPCKSNDHKDQAEGDTAQIIVLLDDFPFTRVPFASSFFRRALGCRRSGEVLRPMK